MINSLREWPVKADPIVQKKKKKFRCMKLDSSFN